MKKALKITGIVIGSLLVLVILAATLVPILFKDQIAEQAKKIINENVNAKVDFKDVSISIFKNFPNVTVSLDNIVVMGVDKFKNDTLAAVGSFGVSVNVMSYLKNKEVDVKSIIIDRPYIHGIILPDGTANWDIAKTDTTTTATTPQPVDTTSGGFKLNLDKVEVNGGTVIYEDMVSKMVAGLKNFDFKLKGKLADEKTTLDVTTSMDNINLFMNGMRFISDASLGIKTKLDADFKNMLYSIHDNEITINNIALQANGTVKMDGKDYEDIVLDLAYALKTESLSALLDMIPSSMAGEAKDVKTSGKMALSGWIKGVYNATSLPQVWAELLVDDGKIKYSHLPKSIDNLNISMKALYDGNDDANTAIDISKFHFEVGGNPFDINMSIRTPMTDADMKAAVKGKIDFASLSEALPLDSMNLSGVVTANVNFAGRMSSIQKELYDKLNVSGTIGVKNLAIKTKDLPKEVQIENADFDFSPRYVELKSFSGKMGKSDLQMQGRLDNLLNYVLKGEMLKGNLQLTSHLVDCNELMASSSTPAASTAGKDTTASAPMSVIVLPGDVDFAINAKVDKVIYDKLNLTNVVGNVTLRNSELNINNLNMGFAGGTMALSGKYKATDPSKAVTGLNVNLKNVEIASVLNSFDMFGKMLPVLGALGGKVSLGFDFATDIDSNMTPVLTSLSGLGIVEGDSLSVKNPENLNKITSLVGIKDVSKVLKSVKANFAVRDGKVQVTPFPVKLGGINMMVGGEQGLDQIANFQIDMAVPAQQLIGKANDLLKQIGLPGSTASTVNVGIAVGGSITSPTFKLVTPKYMESKGVTQQAADMAKEVLNAKKDELLQSLVGGSSKDSTAKASDAQKVNQSVNQVMDLFKKKK